MHKASNASTFPVFPIAWIASFLSSKFWVFSWLSAFIFSNSCEFLLFNSSISLFPFVCSFNISNLLWFSEFIFANSWFLCLSSALSFISSICKLYWFWFCLSSLSNSFCLSSCSNFFISKSFLRPSILSLLAFSEFCFSMLILAISASCCLLIVNIFASWFCLSFSISFFILKTFSSWVWSCFLESMFNFPFSISWALTTFSCSIFICSNIFWFSISAFFISNTCWLLIFAIFSLCLLDILLFSLLRFPSIFVSSFFIFNLSISCLLSASFPFNLYSSWTFKVSNWLSFFILNIFSSCLSDCFLLFRAISPCIFFSSLLNCFCLCSFKYCSCFCLSSYSLFILKVSFCIFNTSWLCFWDWASASLFKRFIFASISPFNLASLILFSPSTCICLILLLSFISSNFLCSANLSLSIWLSNCFCLSSLSNCIFNWLSFDIASIIWPLFQKTFVAW